MAKNNQWMDRLQNVLNSAQDELRRTTIIGKKMINAGKTNSAMRETLEEIGQLAVDEMRKGTLTWEHHRVKELLKIVEKCEDELETIEGQVLNLKKAEFNHAERSDSAEGESPAAGVDINSVNNPDRDEDKDQKEAQVQKMKSEKESEISNSNDGPKKVSRKEKNNDKPKKK